MTKKRDYQREYELSKQRGERDRIKNFTVSMPKELYQEFQEKATINGVKAGTLIKEWIEDYVRNNQGLLAIPKKYSTNNVSKIAFSLENPLYNIHSVFSILWMD